MGHVWTKCPFEGQYRKAGLIIMISGCRNTYVWQNTDNAYASLLHDSLL